MLKLSKRAALVGAAWTVALGSVTAYAVTASDGPPEQVKVVQVGSELPSSTPEPSETPSPTAAPSPSASSEPPPASSPTPTATPSPTRSATVTPQDPTTPPAPTPTGSYLGQNPGGTGTVDNGAPPTTMPDPNAPTAPPSYARS